MNRECHPPGNGAASPLHVIDREDRLRRFPNPASRARYNHIRLTPCSPVIGAEVRGVAASRQLSLDVIEELHRALADWKVLFFRRQEVTAVEHVRFAQVFGDVAQVTGPRRGAERCIERIVHDAEDPGNEDAWHSDGSFRAQPPMGAVLRAVEIPAFEGDTVWANSEAAFEALSSDTQREIENLTAIHEMPAPDAATAVLLQSIGKRSGLTRAEHPLVGVHPETGRRSLYVNEAFTTGIVGLPELEARTLLETLARQLARPEFQVRHRWQQGDIAVWDNRSTVHYGVNDYYPHRRVLERAALTRICVPLASATVL